MLSGYEDVKRQFRPHGETESTERLCERQGFRFLPIVLEAHAGGWATEARRVFGSVARQVAASCRDDREASSLGIAQRISIALHRENARAVLRRLLDVVAVPAASAWEPGGDALD